MDWTIQEQNNTRQGPKQTAPQTKPQSNKKQDHHRDHRPRTASRTNHRGRGAGKAPQRPANPTPRPESTLNILNLLKSRPAQWTQTSQRSKAKTQKTNRSLWQTRTSTQRQLHRAEPRRAKPKTYRQALTNLLKLYEEVATPSPMPEPPPRNLRAKHRHQQWSGRQPNKQSAEKYPGYSQFFYNVQPAP